MTRFGYILAILAASVLAPACTDTLTPSNQPPASGTSSGNTTDTFDHQNDGISPWDLLARLEVEGPPSFTSHMHSCPKVRYMTLGTVLTSLGINIADATALSAGELYVDGYNALGGPNYPQRIRETISPTTSGASREFDIFAAAAPTIIAAFANNTMTRCPGAVLFDTNGQCQASGIQCLIGTPPTSLHIDYCNLIVAQGSTATEGKNLAVATLLASAYTCE